MVCTAVGPIRSCAGVARCVYTTGVFKLNYSGASSADLVPKVAEGSDTDRNLATAEIILLTSVHVRILLRNLRARHYTFTDCNGN